MTTRPLHLYIMPNKFFEQFGVINFRFKIAKESLGSDQKNKKKRQRQKFLNWRISMQYENETEFFDLLDFKVLPFKMMSLEKLLLSACKLEIDSVTGLNFNKNAWTRSSTFETSWLLTNVIFLTDWNVFVTRK